MRRVSGLDHCLPFQFGDGGRVSRFAKSCVRCGKPVDAAQMHGLIKVLPDRAFVSAMAHCPHCQARFPVTCLITADKRVRRLHIPNGLLLFYLQWSMPDVPVQPFVPEAAPTLTAVDPLAVEPTGESLGQYQAQTIYASVRYQGESYRFDRVALQQEAGVAEGELLLAGGLVYRKD